MMNSDHSDTLLQRAPQDLGWGWLHFLGSGWEQILQRSSILTLSYSAP